jgi:hypothetical protein
MRWDALFEDLEQQWDAQARRDLDGEVADRTRRERAAIGLQDRLAGTRGEGIEVTVSTGARLRGPVVDVGRGWLLVGDRGRTPCLIPFPAIAAVSGVGRRATVDAAGRHFGLAYALRGLSRDRAVVSITDVAAAVTVGTVDAVGSDVLELAEHPADAARRPENITGRRLLPFTALVMVRPG